LNHPLKDQLSHQLKRQFSRQLRHQPLLNLNAKTVIQCAQFYAPILA